jgi:transcriptional regulator with XRE-family HTH domain
MLQKTHPKKSPNPTDQYVGSRVRMRRMMLSMSQTELGDAIGVTFQQLQKYEKGTNRISASRLQQIENGLQTSVSFFFEDPRESSTVSEERRGSPSPDYVSEFLTTSDGLALVEAFMRIEHPNVRRSIVRLAQEITKGE